MGDCHHVDFVGHYDTQNQINVSIISEINNQEYRDFLKKTYSLDEEQAQDIQLEIIRIIEESCNNLAE